MSTSFSRPRRRSLLRHLGRVLGLVIQLALLLTPLAEGREERVMNAHVESPQTAPHPGYHADACPVCQMLTPVGRTESPSALPAIEASSTRCAATQVTAEAGVLLASSNCSRAPPSLL
ncbi:MAG: hypothetical protein ABIY52_13580 [Gemmatimonadaceae bacterium]